ncbi:MAG: DNA cytosine methyltransferase [Alphaproteobacteria bacterium]
MQKSFNFLNNEQKAVKQFTFIDLFAGIGGIRLGMEKAGGKCVFTSEWDKHAQKTYFENFGDIPHGDITKINEQDIPKFDVLCAGFPCQPFSQAGFKKGFEDTRGTLFFDILRIMSYHKPKAFFLENVRHLENHDDGKTFQVVINSLKELGYSFFYKVIRASDYGLPQHRPRLYMVGVLNDKFNNFYFPDKVPLKYTMSDILNGKCTKDIGFTLRVGGRGSVITDRRNWEHYWVDDKVFRISSEHAKKMQGFDDSFKFPVSEIQAMKQLGNSVAIDAVYHVAKNLAQYMEMQESA